MNLLNKSDAILSIVPNAKFVPPSTDKYEDIEWLDERPLPSESDIDKELVRLQSEQEKIQYRYERAKKYPTVEECVHALLDGGDTLTELQARRQEVKKEFPKPE